MDFRYENESSIRSTGVADTCHVTCNSHSSPPIVGRQNILCGVKQIGKRWTRCERIPGRVHPVTMVMIVDTLGVMLTMVVMMVEILMVMAIVMV